MNSSAIPLRRCCWSARRRPRPSPALHLNLAVNYSVHRSDVAEKFGWDLPRVFGECMAEYRKALALAPKDVEIALNRAAAALQPFGQVIDRQSVAI